ncbi:MAG: hypothetical protein HY912_05500 [Desulfomonile tiedjei]|uniref:Uncharacterized protein n=1 Tax=Desulfomonile tiedjei TaxID=2358 RepID=A0A9D6UYV4_9BACT|nr:hypothetical protein [Desulfomonile tiedjei]
MKPYGDTQDTDLSSIPSEFRENYRFLSELINCRDKNDSAANELEHLGQKRFCEVRGKLNRRQIKILNDYLKQSIDTELLFAPVPAELEASIRIKKRSTWLPWEAEAIRKIERWRKDVFFIINNWNGGISTSKIS